MNHGPSLVRIKEMLKRARPRTAALIVTVVTLLFTFHAAARDIQKTSEKTDEKAVINVLDGTAQRATSTPVQFEETRRVSLFGTRCSGIATGLDGRIYATGESILLVFQEDGTLGKRIALEGESTCITSDGKDLLYLGMVDHVEVYDSDGRQKDIWVSLGNNAIVTSIAVSKDTVYVADAGNRLVMGFSKTGQLQAILGKKDRKKGIPGFIIPSPYFDVAVGPDQTLWVADTGRLQLENYAPDGALLSSFGTSSMSIEGFCGCCNPTHFALFPEGSFVTSEKGIPRIKVYDPHGNFMGVVAGPEQFKPGSVGLDVAINARGEILVLDPGSGFIRIYTRVSNV